MTLPASGQISMSDVNTELLLTSTATISLNDSAVRTLAGVSSGAISLDNLHGKTNRVSIYITIASNAANYEVKSNVGSTYIAGKSDVYVTVNSGVWVYGSSTGYYGMYIRNFAAGDTVTLINNGLIVGAGGAGGGYANTYPAGAGGNALYVNGVTTRITNNYVIYGGGGGGGEGQGVYSSGRSGTFYYSGGGGGGGTGFVGGAGGTAYPTTYTGANGAAGSSGGPGAGGGGGNPGNGYYGGTGGTGGGWGAAGGGGGGGYGPTAWYGPYAGGAAGYYLVGANYVTWLATGYLAGNVANS